MQHSCCPQDIPLCPAFDDQDFLGERLVIGASVTENFEFTGFITLVIQTVGFDHSFFLGVLFDS
jgi:hypothetical protein